MLPPTATSVVVVVPLPTASLPLLPAKTSVTVSATSAASSSAAPPRSKPAPVAKLKATRPSNVTNTLLTADDDDGWIPKAEAADHLIGLQRRIHAAPHHTSASSAAEPPAHATAAEAAAPVRLQTRPASGPGRGDVTSPSAKPAAQLSRSDVGSWRREDPPKVQRLGTARELPVLLSPHRFSIVGDQPGCPAICRGQRALRLASLRGSTSGIKYPWRILNSLCSSPLLCSIAAVFRGRRASATRAKSLRVRPTAVVATSTRLCYHPAMSQRPALVLRPLQTKLCGRLQQSPPPRPLLQPLLPKTRLPPNTVSRHPPQLHPLHRAENKSGVADEARTKPTARRRPKSRTTAGAVVEVGTQARQA